jgi:hypothetical protein
MRILRGGSEEVDAAAATGEALAVWEAALVAGSPLPVFDSVESHAHRIVRSDIDDPPLLLLLDPSSGSHRLSDCKGRKRWNCVAPVVLSSSSCSATVLKREEAFRTADLASRKDAWKPWEATPYVLLLGENEAT